MPQISRQTTAPLPPSIRQPAPDEVGEFVKCLRQSTGAMLVSNEFVDLASNVKLPPGTYTLYLQQTLEAAGQPTDPILRMLIEQAVMAHHKIARLNRMSVSASSPEVARTYDTSVIGLMAESRRLALAIKAYREPTAQTHVTVVKQQNLAQNQQVAFVEPTPVALEATSPVLEKNDHDTELRSRRLKHGPRPAAFAQSSPSCGRETQPTATKRPVRRGA